MATEKTTAVFAIDGPFKLITTPAFGAGGYTTPYITAATHMALVHNVIIRGLNSIYLQARTVAPNPITSVTPSTKASVQLRDDFAQYCHIWSEFLHAHHHGEETLYFPAIEKHAKAPNLMDTNVDQHKAFGDGLALFDAYITRVSPETYVKNPAERVGEDKFLLGEELCRIIDGFGSTLVHHLTEEIGSLLALESFGHSIPIVRLDAEEGEHVMSQVKLSTVMVMFMVCYDMGFEGGMHAHFPDAPKIIKWLCWYVLPWLNRGLWRFAPCTPAGLLRPLQFVEAKA